MRENRPYGSEGGGPQTNAASLPLFNPRHTGDRMRAVLGAADKVAERLLIGCST